jgi:hypothetical protein
MAGPRTATLLARLTAAEKGTSGPLPFWISFKWISEWCASDDGVLVPERQAAAYRQLLNSFLAGAFRATRVLYLSLDSSAYRGEPIVVQLEAQFTSFPRFAMSEESLRAITKVFSPEDPKGAGVLFDAYLAPCWIKRGVAVRWLENNRYPLPPEWRTGLAPTSELHREERLVTKYGHRPGEKWRPADEPIFQKMRVAIEAGEAISAAAETVADEAWGRGTQESKARRLRRVYLFWAASKG